MSAEQTPSEDYLPINSIDQSCAFCDSRAVVWVHPLDRDFVRFREYGKEHTLPTFWATCVDCELSVAAGDDAALIDRMKQAGFDPRLDDSSIEDVNELLGKPLAAFRRADRGARPLGSGA